MTTVPSTTIITNLKNVTTPTANTCAVGFPSWARSHLMSMYKIRRSQLGTRTAIPNRSWIITKRSNFGASRGAD